MTNLFPDLINTQLQAGGEAQSNASRFDGFLAASKPLSRFGACSYRKTGLKPGVNESVSGKLLLLIFLLTLCFSRAALAAQAEDAEYEAVAEEYIKTYLAAHPLEGAALGLHEYTAKSVITAGSPSTPNFPACDASMIDWPNSIRPN